MPSTVRLAICALPVLPVRASASHASEMVSELIFGECFEVLKTQAGHWLRVKSVEDGYEGWCHCREPLEVDEDIYQQTGEPLTGDWAGDLTLDGRLMRVPLGSRLKGWASGKGVWGKAVLAYGGSIIPQGEQVPNRERIAAFSSIFQGSSYLWGGKTVFGLDCSGFTQSVYRLIGIRISRDSSRQQQEGEPVGSPSDAQYGDLAFFSQSGPKATHVGIVLEPGQIIHCSGWVRKDKLDGEGIRLASTGELTHQLIGIRRYFQLK